MKLFNSLRLLAALSLAGSALLAQAADFTVAYQTTVDPAKVAQADGAYEKATGSKIAWRKFENGADVITAIASGDVQIGYLGSSPLTAAATRKLPVETFLIATQIGAAEALVARNGSGINGSGIKFFGYFAQHCGNEFAVLVVGVLFERLALHSSLQD